MLDLKCHCKLLEMKRVKFPFLISPVQRTSLYSWNHEGPRGSERHRAYPWCLSPVLNSSLLAGMEVSVLKFLEKVIFQSSFSNEKLDTKGVACLSSWEWRYILGLCRLSMEAIPLAYRPRQNPKSHIRAQSHRLCLLLLTFLILGLWSHPRSFPFALCYKWLRWEKSFSL